jgi:hypothetical protein
VARTVRVHLLDDIDGSPADENIVFALDGVAYDIDLNSTHAKDLRSAIDPFVSAARRVPRSAIATRIRGGARTPARVDRDQNQAIREWAKRENIELSGRGRIPRGIIEQYEARAGR